MLLRLMASVLVATCGLVWLSPASAELVPLGDEFQVNTHTTVGAEFTAVAIDPMGNFVVVWESYGSNGSDTDGQSIQAQRYDATGAPLGIQFQVNTYTTSRQRLPAVAADALGNFVIVWTSYGSGSDPGSASVQGQRYDATGAPQGGQFQLNTYTTNYQRTASVAADAVGNFVVVWSSNGSNGTDTDNYSIQARRYDASGAPQGGEFQVNTYTTHNQGGQSSAVAMEPTGKFVVVWDSRLGGGGSDTDYSVEGQRFDATGAPQGGQFQVNTYTTFSQYFPSVAMNASGAFVVVWTSQRGDGSDTSYESVHGQRYDASGTPAGAEFQVNTYTTNVQRSLRHAVAKDAAGNFVVVWSSQDPDENAHGQRYDAGGTPLGAQFRVNTHTTNGQYFPTVATDALGNFVVAWYDGDQDDIRGQRFGADGRPILGKKLLVKDPSGSEEARTLIALGKEPATDIGPTILGDPTTSGATLRVITKGATDSDQTYLLGAAGWSALGTVGYKYLGPTDGDGDPVKKVLLKRTAGGTALVKAILKGSVGTQNLDVVPPNLGDDGGIVLTIPGGAAYCAFFGGVAGGSEVKDGAQLWKVTNATGQGCPLP